MYETLLFDLDGTLADSLEGVYRSLRWAIQSVGGADLPRSEARRFLLSIPLEQVLEEQYGYDRSTALLVRERYMEHYPVHGMERTAPIPGMAELAARLKEQGFRLAVASCKPWIYCGPTLEQCGFADCFEAVVGSGRGGVPEEKSAVIREALRLLDAPAETALMIGDRAVDVQGARECGVPCVGVEFCGYAGPGELEEAGAVAVVRTAGELEAFLTGRRPDMEVI